MLNVLGAKDVISLKVLFSVFLLNTKTLYACSYAGKVASYSLLVAHKFPCRPTLWLKTLSIGVTNMRLFCYIAQINLSNI